MTENETTAVGIELDVAAVTGVVSGVKMLAMLIAIADDEVRDDDDEGPDEETRDYCRELAMQTIPDVVKAQAEGVTEKEREEFAWAALKLAVARAHILAAQLSHTLLTVVAEVTPEAMESKIEWIKDAFGVTDEEIAQLREEGILPRDPLADHEGPVH